MRKFEEIVQCLSIESSSTILIKQDFDYHCCLTDTNMFFKFLCNSDM